MKSELYPLNWSHYDWREFEKICFEYIKTIYSAQFYKTKLTRAQKDQGRDIVIKEKKGGFEAWGECKDHKRNIGLSVIGKNIVLALSHQINKAIFFSVTPITLNTKIEILNVSQKSEFEVLFLDGNELNIAILSCPKVAKKYFREEYEKYIIKNRTDIWIDTLFSEYPFAEDAKNNTKMQYHLENGFQVFLHIFIKNMNDKSIQQIHLKLTGIPESDMIFYESDFSWHGILTTHADLLYTFRGVIFTPKKNIVLPHVYIDCLFTDGTKQQYTIETGVADASDVWKAPYTNSQSASFFNGVAKILEEVVPKKYVRVLFIYGNSGMGKSRLMTEIENKAYENSYRVIHIDFRAQEEITAIRTLIIALLGLPLSKNKANIEFSDFKKAFSNRLEIYTIRLLYQFLYNNSNLDSNYLAESLIDLLVTLPDNEPLMIGMDNIQELSNNAQILFWNVLEHCRNVSIPVCFVFSQNTERYPDISNVLIEYLNLFGEQHEKFISKYHCGLLVEEDAIILMQELLHLTSECHDLLKELLQNIELCPMDILLLSKSLEEKKDLFYTKGSTQYIVEPCAFSQEVEAITNSTDTIIRNRLSNIEKSETSVESFMQLFSLITFFDGKLPVEIFEKCKFELELLDYANHNLITKAERAENIITFYHEKIYSYFKRNPINIAMDILNGIMEAYYDICDENIVSSYVFLKVLIAKKKEKEAIIFGFQILEAYKTASDNKKVCKVCDALLSIVNQQFYPVEYFRILFCKADMLLERVNISEAEELFEEAKQVITDQYTFFAQKEVIHFFHRYINQKLHTMQYEKALQIMKEFEMLYIPNSEISMIVNDRRCVALYGLRQEKEAIDAIDKVIDIAKSKRDYVWLSIAYSDKAFTYFFNSKNITKICDNFKKAVDYYEQSGDCADLSRKIEIQIQSTIVCILENNDECALKHIQKSGHIAEKTGYGYLLIPSLNINALLMIRKGDIDAAQRLLKKAFSYANIFSNAKALVSIYNNLGNVFAERERYEQAQSYYSAAITTLKKICIPQNCFRYAGLLCNMIKVSIFLGDISGVNEIIDTYEFDELVKYKIKCHNSIQQEFSIKTFSYGVLSHDGYDYLY